jgi:hypothetical protein
MLVSFSLVCEQSLILEVFIFATYSEVSSQIIHLAIFIFSRGTIDASLK